jgi:hypothetical protein
MALWPILGGAALAILLGRWELRIPRVRFGNVLVAIIRPAQRTGLVLGTMIERVDGMLRQWPTAGLSLLVLAIILGRGVRRWPLAHTDIPAT